MRFVQAALCPAIALLMLGCSTTKTTSPLPAPTSAGVAGRVLMATNGTPVQGATIFTVPPSGTTLSDPSGNYYLPIPDLTQQYTLVAIKGLGLIISQPLSLTAGTTSPIDLSLVHNFPPILPYGPIPSDGSIYQPDSLTLQWSCGDPDGNPMTYDVYVDTLTPPRARLGHNLGTARLTISGLVPNTTYSWEVVAKDNRGGITQGSPWSFVTLPPRTRPTK